jgi:hypothetical protein
MKAEDLPGWGGWENVERLVPGRLIGLQGRLARPFWGVMGIWAVLCGALASDRFRWNDGDLLTLALAMLLADLAWGTVWDLAAGIDWFRPLAEDWPPAHPAQVAALPYTQPNSPGGRFFRGLNRLAGWWQESFWPAAGSALLGVLAAAALATVLTLLLPARLRPLNAVLVALVGLGMVRRRWGKPLLAGQALAQVGLGWLAGHLAFAEMSGSSLSLALAFALAAWGSMRAARELSAGVWFQDGAQAMSAILLAVLKQPVAAGVVGLLLFGQVATQPLLRLGGDPARLFRRAWPWLMATMLVAALALP